MAGVSFFFRVLQDILTDIFIHILVIFIVAVAILFICWFVGWFINPIIKKYDPEEKFWDIFGFALFFLCCFFYVNCFILPLFW